MEADGREEARKTRIMRGLSSTFAMPVMDPKISERLPAVKISTLLLFQKPLDLESTRRLLRERLCAIGRFRSRVVATSRNRFAFVELADSEVDAAMPELVGEERSIKTQQDVDGFVSAKYQQQTNPDLPLWRAWVVNDMADGRSALLMLIDHTIADGVALVQVLMSVLDDAPKLPLPSRRADAPRPSCCARIKGLFQSCWGPLVGDQLPADPANRLKVKDPRYPGREKALCTSDAVPLSKVKQVKQAIPGSTINDVLMTLTALTLQEYFRRHEPSTLRKKVRANFPYNLRTGVTGEQLLSEEQFGNRWSQGQLTFPLGVEDPLAVMADIKRQIDIVKASPEPLFRDKLVQFLILRSGLPRSFLANQMLQAFGKPTLALSNVPFSLEEVRLMGQPLDDLSFYALTPVGLYFGIIQYKGSFKVGIVSDAACEPEPKKLADCWAPAFERLYGAAVAKTGSNLGDMNDIKIIGGVEMQEVEVQA